MFHNVSAHALPSNGAAAFPHEICTSHKQLQLLNSVENYYSKIYFPSYLNIHSQKSYQNLLCYSNPIPMNANYSFSVLIFNID